MPPNEGIERAEVHPLVSFAPGNRAARLGARLERAWNDGRIDEVRSSIDDSFSISSNRTVAAAGDSEGETAVIQVLSIHAYFPNCRFDALAARDDDLMLMRWNLWSDGGDEMEMVVVTQVNPTGLLQRGATFDAGAAEHAFVLLDRWATERSETA